MSIRPVNPGYFAYREVLAVDSSVKFEFEETVMLHQLTLVGIGASGTADATVKFYEPGSFSNISEGNDESSPIEILSADAGVTGFLLNPYTGLHGEPLPSCMLKGSVLTVTNESSSTVEIQVFLTIRS